MSAAHRPVEGGGGYYGGAGADVLARQRGEGEAEWRTGYYPQEAERSWAGGGTGGGAPGTQNSSYPGYNPNWSCSGHPRHPYPTNYPARDQQETVSAYQYREAASGLHQPAMPQHSPQGEGWVYGVPNPYHWPTAPPAHHNPANSHYVPGGRAGWPGADIPNASYDIKDPSQASNYNRQRPPYQSYHPETPQTVTPSEPKPNPPTPHYSSSPQMYHRKEPPSQESASRAKEADPDPMRNHPAIVKIIQILEKVVDLEREVDEFVGRKTDMSYRYLEELLTKQLLELDSVETGGQDNIRQARKEAVNKLQSILERLERKGF
ncbi:hypothetical protein XENTR_v10009820 [Xenopus tropicalis]|nr:hypothetical protein XENTR_v10009820 [Xenopus tropicalis]